MAQKSGVLLKRINLLIDSVVNATLQGNKFNGKKQLVQTDADGKLPSLDGSNLTNLPGGVGTAWGGITGTLTAQADLESRLSDIEVDVSVNQLDISDLQSDVTTLQNDIPNKLTQQQIEGII